MRASFLYGGGVQLEQATKALRSAYTPPPKPKPRPPIFSVGFLVGLVSMVVALGSLAWPRTPNADPIGHGRLNNARASATPEHIGLYVEQKNRWRLAISSFSSWMVATLQRQYECR